MEERTLCLWLYCWSYGRCFVGPEKEDIFYLICGDGKLGGHCGTAIIRPNHRIVIPTVDSLQAVSPHSLALLALMPLHEEVELPLRPLFPLHLPLLFLFFEVSVDAPPSRLLRSWFAFQCGDQFSRLFCRGLPE